MRQRRRNAGYSLPYSECLTASEVERLIKAAQYCGRYGLRDATLILLAYRHGFRVSELINLKWSHIDFETGTVLVSRFKNGRETVHPLTAREISNLRELERYSADSELVFISNHKGPLSTSTVQRMVRRAGEEAGLRNPVQPYMLHQARGFDLATATSSNHTTRH
jgi:type 1 fimbriae regulatory protein FimB/type 1 fimbriae regulatory protein FimE